MSKRDNEMNDKKVSGITEIVFGSLQVELTETGVVGPRVSP